MGVTGDGVTPKLQNLPGGKKNVGLLRHTVSRVFSLRTCFLLRGKT